MAVQLVGGLTSRDGQSGPGAVGAAIAGAVCVAAPVTGIVGIGCLLCRAVICRASCPIASIALSQSRHCTRLSGSLCHFSSSAVACVRAFAISVSVRVSRWRCHLERGTHCHTCLLLASALTRFYRFRQWSPRSDMSMGEPTSNAGFINLEELQVASGNSCRRPTPRPSLHSNAIWPSRGAQFVFALIRSVLVSSHLLPVL